MNSARKINLGAGVIVALAIVGFVWSWTARAAGNAGALAYMVLPSSGFVLLFAVYAAIANGTAIVDWFRVRVPPVIHDDVLGDLRYHDRVWKSHPDRAPVFWIMGRRIGPDS